MRFKSAYIAVAAILLLVIVGFTFAFYEGSAGPFLLFNVSYLLLMLLAVPRPRLYVYTFLSLFLFLGFWMRFTFHTILGYGYQQAVGNFDGSGTSWDLVLLVASSGAIGVVLVRCLYLWFARRSASETPDYFESARVPQWYIRYKKLLWIVTILVVVALNGWNSVAGFYQIGVNPRVVLPLHLNVVTAWLLNIGFALWIAVLVHWETALRRSALKYTLLAPLAEGLISTVSILSRSVYLFHTLPYVFVVAERELRSALSRRTIGTLAVLFTLVFVLGLAGVSGLRLYTYPSILNLNPNNPILESGSSSGADPASPSAGSSSGPDLPENLPTRNQVVAITVKQVLRLFVDRWNGLEGVFAVSAHEGLGYELLVEGVKEDPNSGQNSLYQAISNSSGVYLEQEGFTFLNLAGVMAILFYSGSLLVVMAGMAVVTSFMMAIELVFSRLIGNPFLSAVSGLAMANVICQMNFPYLTGVFFVELTSTLAFVWLIQTFSKKTPIPTTGQVSHKGA